MKDNPDAILGVQANESFMVNASPGQILGSGGETVGFAKYQQIYTQELATQMFLELDSLNSQIEQSMKQPEVAQYFELKNDIVGNIPIALKKANSELKQLEHLPENDPARLQAQQKVNDLESQLEQKQKQFAIATESSPVKAHMALVAKKDQQNIRVEIPNNVNLSTQDLFPKKYDKEGIPTNMDPSEGGDRAMLTRAVASKLVDNVIGTQSLSEEKFGADEQGRPIGISVQVDGAGVLGTYQGEDTYLQIDYSDPEIQKGLSDLQVNDFITGQIDRHCGNIFIDPVTKKVTGIDNDLAFPETDRDDFTTRKTANGKVVKGLPETMHKDTAQKILDLSPHDLRRQLMAMEVPNGVGRLSKASIDGAVDRLKTLQQEIKNGNIQVVEKFDKQTYQSALDKQNEAVKQKLNGVALQDATSKHEWSLTKVDPTSYQGAIALNIKRYEIAQKVPRPVNSIKPAQRNPQVEEFLKTSTPIRQDIQKQINLKLAPERKELIDKLTAYEKRLQELHNSSPNLAKLKSLRYGGIDKAVAEFEKKIDRDLQQLNKLDEKAKVQVDLEMDKLNEGLWNKAGKQVERQNQLKQPQGLDLKQETGLEISEKEARQLLHSLDKLSGEQKQDGLSLNEQEAGELLKSLNKLSNHPKESRRDSLKLNDQEADELLKALDKLSPEQLKQVQTKSETIQITDEQLDQLINELKSMDVDEPSESVASKLHMNHVGSGKSTQKQSLGERPKLRDAFPELVHDQGQKKEGPKQGNLRV